MIIISFEYQIILYLFSRVVLALVKVPVKRQIIDAPQHTYPVFAAVVWGIVMVRHELHSSIITCISNIFLYIVVIQA